MPQAIDTCALQGLQLTVTDADATAALLEGVLGLPRCGPDPQGAIVFGIGTRRLTLHARSAEQADGLHWHCRDLAAQRALLGQLGIEAPEELDTELCVGGVDTGACALVWADAPLPLPSAHMQIAAARLDALVLHARAPERVAAHWAQMFHSPLSRDAHGAPRLLIDGVSLAFAFAEDDAGVRELTLAVHDMEIIGQRAAAAGVTRSGDALLLAGLTVRLAAAA